MIYLDHAATTPTDRRVIEEMARCMRENWRNPSAAYAGAGAARRALREARQAADEGRLVLWATNDGREEAAADAAIHLAGH